MIIQCSHGVVNGGSRAGDVNEICAAIGRYCHCTIGMGTPLAVALKVKKLPASTVWSVGWAACSRPLHIARQCARPMQEIAKARYLLQMSF
jgi:hypothetical protein